MPKIMTPRLIRIRPKLLLRPRSCKVYKKRQPKESDSGVMYQKAYVLSFVKSVVGKARAKLKKWEITRVQRVYFC